MPGREGPPCGAAEVGQAGSQRSATRNRSKPCVSSDRRKTGGPARLQTTEPGTKGLAPMGIESKESRTADGVGLERAIVLQLLRDDHERMWSREQLMAELQPDRSATGGPDGSKIGEPEESGIGREVVEQTLRRLEQEGVIGLSAEAIWASSAARRLDELGLIGV